MAAVWLLSAKAFMLVPKILFWTGVRTKRMRTRTRTKRRTRARMRRSMRDEVVLEVPMRIWLLLLSGLLSAQAFIPHLPSSLTSTTSFLFYSSSLFVQKRISVFLKVRPLDSRGPSARIHVAYLHKYVVDSKKVVLTTLQTY